MSQRSITYTNVVDGVLTDATSVVLRDPTGAFGARRLDTHEIIVAAGAALAHISAGTYKYTFLNIDPNVSYEYWLERVYNGGTKRTRETLLAAAAGSGATGSQPIPPATYVTMGVETVSCGDSELENFLRSQATLLWAMQLRRGTALDLRYQYFVLELIGLAMDQVRSLIDTQVEAQQSQDTSYSNGLSTGNADASSSSSRTASAAQSSDGSRSMSSSSSRSSTAQSALTSSQSSTRTGSGSDHSTQLQTQKSVRTVSQHLDTTTTPVHGTIVHTQDYKLADSVIHNNMETEEDAIRYSTQILDVGSFSGQSGNLGGGIAKRTANHGVGNTSSISMTGRDSGSSVMKTGNKLSGKGRDSSGALTGGGGGRTITDFSMIGTGSRTNSIHRSSSGSSTGTSSSTQSSHSTTTSHAEQHSANTAVSHSESLAHSESASSAVTHHEQTGAGSMSSTMALDKNYYGQIFQSLKQMREDTVAQIKRLEQQVSLSVRYTVQRLTKGSSQAVLLQGRAGNPIANSPDGMFPFNTGR